MSQGHAARVLGVSREHLNRVLRGKLRNPTLLRDYQLFVQRNTKPNPPTENEKSHLKN